jgi:hypothetical protein
MGVVAGLNHFPLTLLGTGTPVNLATTLGQNLACSYVSIQSLKTNSNEVFIGGGNATVTTTSYAHRIPAPASSEPAAPDVLEKNFEGNLNLNTFNVIGTNAETLLIGFIPL